MYKERKGRTRRGKGYPARHSLALFLTLSDSLLHRKQCIHPHTHPLFTRPKGKVTRTQNSDTAGFDLGPPVTQDDGMKAERWAWVRAARSAWRCSLFGPWCPERRPWAVSCGGQRGPPASVSQLRPALAQYLLVVKLWLGRRVCPSDPMSWNRSLQCAMLGGQGPSEQSEQARRHPPRPSAEVPAGTMTNAALNPFLCHDLLLLKIEQG